MILLQGEGEGGLDLAYSGPQAAVRGAHWSLLMSSKQVSILSVTVLQSTAAPHTRSASLWGSNPRVRAHAQQ